MVFYLRRLLGKSVGTLPLLVIQRSIRVGSVPAPVVTMGVKERFDNILKSEEDKRLYRGLVLDNGMRVFLVSDEATDKSAACMDVSVGYMSDPTTLPGLAHFCEHMLFLGTAKYPGENEYSKFLSEHGGRSNAHTAADHTDYYFDVAPDHFKAALDIFAQFFIEPLFTEGATDREVNAIESEHSKNILNDTWRFSQLGKSISKPDHPYSQFGTGNKETLVNKPKELGISVRDELLAFHSKWYSSNLMNLAIIGKDTLDELESMVVELFSHVKCVEGAKAPSWPESPCGPEQLQKRSYVIPIKDVRRLFISFPIPDLSHLYRAHPEFYVSHLIGHEGPGSILSTLRTRGWVNVLSAGQQNEARGFCFFTVRMDLTEEGMLHIDDIITLVFQYINLLKKEGPREDVYDEMRGLNNLSFRFEDKEAPLGHVVTLGYCTRLFPEMEYILKGPYLCEDWQPEIIEKEVIGNLRPDNMRISVVAQQFKSKADLKEPWYGTEYTIEDIPPETIEKWGNVGLCEELALPPRNEFIPTDFSVLPVDPDVKPFPVIIHDTMLSRVWYRQDDKFRLPKSSIRLEVTSPLAYQDPLNCNKAVIFVHLLEDALNEYVYAALLAGLSYRLMVTTSGLQLYIEGYNNKQHILLTKIVDKLANMKINPQRYEILKEKYVRSLQNFELEQPRIHANYFMGVLMTEMVWTKEDLLAAVEEMSVESIQEFIPQLLSSIHLEFLIHGNVSKEAAMEIVSIVEESIKKRVNIHPLLPKQLTRARQLQLADGCNFLYRLPISVHPLSCTLVYLQCGELSTENNMKLELFTQILSEPSHDILRTKEQLGYIVFCGTRCSNTEQGLRILVQSNREPDYVEQRVEAFIEQMGKYVLNMPDADFERHREALAVKRLVKPKKLQALTDTFWGEIVCQLYHFDRDNVEVAYLRTITKQDLMKYYEEMIHHSAPKRRKLTLQVLPKEDSDKLLRASGEAAVMDNGKLPDDLYPAPEIIVPQVPIEDVLAFQRSQSLCSYPKPFMNIAPPSIGARSKL